MLHCDYCGIEEAAALANHSHMCAPPFERRPHEFTGLHPADKAEPTLQDKSRANGRSIDPNANPNHERCAGSGWYMLRGEIQTCECVYNASNTLAAMHKRVAKSAAAWNLAGGK